jgi:hypothetical protein
MSIADIGVRRDPFAAVDPQRMHRAQQKEDGLQQTLDDDRFHRMQLALPCLGGQRDG